MNKIFSPHNSLKHVLIVHTDGNSFNNPSLKCLMDLLLEKDCQIDLRYPKSDAPMPDTKGIRLMPFGKIVRILKNAILNRLCSWPLVYISVFIEKLIYYGDYDLIIGVDRQGLIEASILSDTTGVPYIFISFEIMFESETSARYKSLERRASENIALWIVQDEVRAEQLQHENDLQPANRMLLPLASAGAGVEKAIRLRDSLGIPRDKKVVISIGSISKWSMTRRILKAVASWPEEWVLVVHERYGRTRILLAGEYDLLAGLVDRRIYISEAATDNIDDMGGILAGITAGLAFYEPDFNGPYTGNNLVYLGMASGKLSTYLRYGVPIITNKIGPYANEARKFRFGCVVDTPENIVDTFIDIDRIEYRRSALDYFSTRLDFNIYKDVMWSRLLSIYQNRHT